MQDLSFFVARFIVTPIEERGSYSFVTELQSIPPDRLIFFRDLDVRIHDRYAMPSLIWHFLSFISFLLPIDLKHTM